MSEGRVRLEGAGSVEPTGTERRPGRRQDPAPPLPLSPGEPVARAVGLAVLLLVRGWNGQLPRSSIAGILRGDDACSVVWNYGPERFAQFAALRGRTYREIVRDIDLLILKGLLRVGRGIGEKNKIWLTEAGDQALGPTAPMAHGAPAPLAQS